MKEAIAVYRMLNPNVKPPANSSGDRNLEKLGSEKKKNNHDADASNMDNDDVDDKGEGGDADDVDAESGVCSSQKVNYHWFYISFVVYFIILSFEMSCYFLLSFCWYFLVFFLCICFNMIFMHHLL